MDQADPRAEADRQHTLGPVKLELIDGLALHVGIHERHHLAEDTPAEPARKFRLTHDRQRSEGYLLTIPTATL
ncbi:MAG: hypothetical protein ACR2NR_08625 [Solirubrobacteraceae bacterium]